MAHRVIPPAANISFIVFSLFVVNYDSKKHVSQLEFCYIKNGGHFQEGEVEDEA